MTTITDVFGAIFIWHFLWYGVFIMECIFLFVPIYFFVRAIRMLFNGL